MAYVNLADLTAAPEQAPSGTSGPPGQAQSILELMNQLNAGTRPDPTELQAATTEDPGSRKRRLIGSLIAGALGALANRNTREGGLAGFAGAAGGYNSGVMAKDQAAQAMKLDQIKAERENKMKMAAESLKEIVKGRFPSAEHLPNEFKIWQQGQGNPEFLDWYGQLKNKETAAKMSNELADFRQMFGRNPKTVEEYQIFKQKSLTPMDLAILNDLGIPVKQFFNQQRPGGGGGTPGAGAPPKY